MLRGAIKNSISTSYGYTPYFLVRSYHNIHVYITISYYDNVTGQKIDEIFKSESKNS